MFSMASMTDVIFLLLIFFMVTSTFVFPSAMEVNLPQSGQQTAIKPTTRIYIDKDMMNKERGFGARAMGILEGFGIPFEHAPTGIDSMSIIVDTAHLKPAQAEVIDAIERQLQPDKVRVFDEIALVATVGHGMTGQVGVAAKLFGALAAENVSVRVIDQGSSEINIIVGVDDADYDRAIRAIYAEFVGERG